jgi:hypothetical protein
VNLSEQELLQDFRKGQMTENEGGVRVIRGISGGPVGGGWDQGAARRLCEEFSGQIEGIQGGEEVCLKEV